MHRRLEAEAASERMSVGAFIRESVDYRMNRKRTNAHAALRRMWERADATADGRDTAQACILLNFDHEVLEVALGLIENTRVRGRDAVHAATALAYGIETIASSDPAFDVVPGLRRVDPLRA